MLTACLFLEATLFLTARGPGYLVMVLALIVIFGLEWIVRANSLFSGPQRKKKT
jgi:hypothetical protein